MCRPTVSVITVNYNQAHVTCALLRSIQQYAPHNIEVIVIDNCSAEPIEPILREQFPEVICISSPHNRGFAGGNNLGIMAAKGKYLLFLNNDTEITSGMIETLLAACSRLPDAGIVCPKICYFEPPRLIQYVGYTEMNPYTARNTTVGNGEPDQGQYNKTMRTHYAHGAAMMLPRSVVDKVGMMPECFFLYYEELDWCEQIKRAGYGIYVEPSALVYHKESVSVGRNSPFKTYYITRNRILFMRRNAITKLRLLLFYAFMLLFALPKNLLSFALHREPQHARAFLRGILWHFNPSYTY